TASPAPNAQSSPSKWDSRPFLGALARMWSSPSPSNRQPSPKADAEETMSACMNGQPSLDGCPAAAPAPASKPVSPASPKPTFRPATSSSSSSSSSTDRKPSASKHPHPPHPPAHKSVPKPAPSFSSMAMAASNVPPASPIVPLIWAGKNVGAPKPVCTKAMFLPTAGLAGHGSDGDGGIRVAPGVMAGELGMMHNVPGPCTTYTSYHTVTHTVKCGGCVVEPKTLVQAPHVMCKSIATGVVGTRTVLGCRESEGVGERFRRYVD
ncbi:hypothetical protein LTS18_004388, partial [Coniosporium uncinatum]